MSAVWLVDMGYVVKAAKDRFRLDYIAARALLAKELGPTRAWLFNGYDAAYGVDHALQAFYRAMEDQGMTVCLHPMRHWAQGLNQQRRVDVDLAAHLVWQATRPEVETLVLTTGDQDLLPAVVLVQETLGKDVILFTYDAAVNSELADTAAEWWLFEDDREALER